ncbi:MULTISPECIES: DUF6223 family protein [Nonomuraea]|uniref:DUF6223 family protein n=1 Tax=Nonomuraea mangrovi TaxID=2316207 RepID=A0ABW4SXW8_9ACTN
MSIRHFLATAAAGLLGPPDAPGISYLSAGRLGAIVAALVGLTAVAIGGLVLTGRIGTVNRRRWAIVALLAGLISVAVGGSVVATSDGGIGTGNGLAGAVVALVVGLIGTALGGLALARSRRQRLVS